MFTFSKLIAFFKLTELFVAFLTSYQNRKFISDLVLGHSNLTLYFT